MARTRRGRHLPAVLLTFAMLALVAAAAISNRHSTPSPAGPPAGHVHPELVAAALSSPTALPTAGWTVTTDSQETAKENGVAGNVLDGSTATIWHSAWSTTPAAPLPHTLTIDMHTTNAVSWLTYLPRQDGNRNGNIGQYRIDVSNDGTAYTGPVATGTFADDATLKTVTFGTVLTRYVRLTALTDAGNRGPWSSAAEVALLGGADPPLPRTGWTATADSQETAKENGVASNVLDGNTATIWHTAWSTSPAAPLPHWITVDMHGTNLVSGLAYLPRQDGNHNGTIGQYRIETSTDGTTWGAPAATGTFPDATTAQTVTFPPALARYVRLTALSEAGNRGPWSSAAELNLLGRPDPTLVRTGWTATADSQETAKENGAASNALDGNTTTIWHTAWSTTPPAPLPHTLTLDLQAATSVGGVTYLPRQDGSANGRIGVYTVDTSTDGTQWTAAATGTFADDSALKTVAFPTVTARYVRLTAKSEAGNRGPWTSAAEVNVLGPTGAAPVVKGAQGAWSAPIGFPLVPVAAAVLPNGKILTWSSYKPDSFGGTGQTVTALYDPATGVVTEATITSTGHDMFCPGISVLPDGRVIVTGGDDSSDTSLYDPATDTWTAAAKMNLGRGYQASVTLSTGGVFTIGGSWSGGQGGKNGEVWTAASGWQLLPGAPVAPMLTADAQGVYRADNHAWLFAWSGGMVLQAGPSRAMNWY